MALMVDATPLQASTQNPVVLGLDQQTTPVNQTEIVVARTPRRKQTLNGLMNLISMPGTIETGHYSVQDNIYHIGTT